MKEKLWRAAFAQTLPVLAGYLFLGFAYGVLMRRAGFSTLWAVGLSLFIYAGSMQYAAVPVLTGAFDPIGAFLLSIMVNARHMFTASPCWKNTAGPASGPPTLFFP